MRAYGYEWDSGAETPEQLKEAGIVCTKSELDRLITFLSDIRSHASCMSEAEGEHWHYRDWDENWSDCETDLIIFLRK